MRIATACGDRPDVAARCERYFASVGRDRRLREGRPSRGSWPCLGADRSVGKRDEGDRRRRCHAKTECTGREHGVPLVFRETAARRAMWKRIILPHPYDEPGAALPQDDPHEHRTHLRERSGCWETRTISSPAFPGTPPNASHSAARSMSDVEVLRRSLAARYAVETEVGAGGMATVYRARDLKHDRQVAIKVLTPELGAVLGVERFLSEIKVTANLQHPNLLPLFDSGEADGLLYYVMPYIEGETLRHRIDREKQLPVDEAMRIATAVASALDYAHRHGVIHRDLKPENILLHDGQPLVADFGIALAVSNAGGQRITQTGLSLGTPQYMAPDQATDDRITD